MTQTLSLQGQDLGIAARDSAVSVTKISKTNQHPMYTLSDLSKGSGNHRRSSSIILLVEDNETLRNGIQLILEGDGFTVIPAVHGRDALERMKAVLPDLILSDISMPIMDGYTLFDEVRAKPEWLTIPFIFLTARGGEEEIFRGKRLGAEDYLVKPVSGRELLTIIRSRLARSEELLLAQLHQAYESSLILFANAIELRDQYTRGHVERVRDYSLSIARQLGLDLVQMEALQYGSILHDIGKIYISESILSKPGALSQDEWNEMKRHPSVGADLIRNIPYLDSALPIIRYHHERWDGKGYPEGLQGEKIPLAARIVAVADSLDAMTTSRVYQEPCSGQRAYIEILRGSGTRYDPLVIEAFKRSWLEIQQRMD